jgi:hypothetical protein
MNMIHPLHDSSGRDDARDARVERIAVVARSCPPQALLMAWMLSPSVMASSHIRLARCDAVRREHARHHAIYASRKSSRSRAVQSRRLTVSATSTVHRMVAQPVPVDAESPALVTAARHELCALGGGCGYWGHGLLTARAEYRASAVGAATWALRVKTPSLVAAKACVLASRKLSRQLLVPRRSSWPGFRLDAPARSNELQRRHGLA